MNIKQVLIKLIENPHKKFMHISTGMTMWIAKDTNGIEISGLLYIPTDGEWEEL